jgi:hypothetical protein
MSDDVMPILTSVKTIMIVGFFWKWIKMPTSFEILHFIQTMIFLKVFKTGDYNKPVYM